MTFTAPADPLGGGPPPSAEPRAPLRRTLALARPAAGRLTLATVLGGCAAAAAIGLLATSAWLISRASEQPPILTLTVAIVGVRFFGISRGVFRYGERVVGHDAALRLLADLRVSVYRRLERLAPAGLPAFRSGDLLARLVGDVDTMQDLLLRVVPAYAIALVVGAATVGLVTWLLPAAGAVLLAALLAAALAVPALTAALARRSEARQAPARGELAAAVVDLLQGAPDLVANGAVAAQRARVARLDDELTVVAAATSRNAGVGSGLTAVLGGAAVWGALAVGIPAVADGRLDGVALAVVVLTPLAAFELVAGLPMAAQSLERVRQAAARVFAVLDAPEPVVEPAVAAALPAAPDGHTMVVRGLRARYRDDAGWALDGVDLDLPPGRRVAVVGPSGAGKSTLAAVLLRFLPYAQGSVTLDGVELATLDGDTVRGVVGLAAQDAHVFDTTLEENLRLARRSATADELRAALAAARLLAWVDGLPEGLGTAVGEHGSRLSGGQRQRLALARVVLAGAPVLVLDEPAEHLDTTTADALTADLLDVTRGRTTLVITHRLTGLDQVDEVVVLDGGRVRERGTHADLVAGGGWYAEQWHRERETEEVAWARR
jgi:thiol reductant ABC exporter CydC subunit